jgi:hypothetical protein
MSRRSRAPERITFKQMAVALMGPALLLLALAAAFSHYAGSRLAHPGQVVPVIFGVVGGLMLSTLGLRHFGRVWVCAIGQVVGAFCGVVGVIGLMFHLVPVAQMCLDAKHWTLEVVFTALLASPPLLAPLGFTLIGAVLWCIVSPRFFIGFHPAAAAEDEERVPEPPVSKADVGDGWDDRKVDSGAWGVGGQRLTASLSSGDVRAQRSSGFRSRGRH